MVMRIYSVVMVASGSSVLVGSSESISHAKHL